MLLRRTLRRDHKRALQMTKVLYAFPRKKEGEKDKNYPSPILANRTKKGMAIVSYLLGFVKTFVALFQTHWLFSWYNCLQVPNQQISLSYVNKVQTICIWANHVLLLIRLVMIYLQNTTSFGERKFGERKVCKVSTSCTYPLLPLYIINQWTRYQCS